MTATTIPLHASRTSEGTLSAQRILDPRASLTADPYLLRTDPPALHRIDTHHMAAPCHMVAGRTDEPQEHPADDRQGHGMDHLYRGRTLSDRVRRAVVADPTEHAEPEKSEAERDPASLRWFVAGYLAFLVLCMVGIANGDAIHQWLSR